MLTWNDTVKKTFENIVGGKEENANMKVSSISFSNCVFYPMKKKYHNYYE